MLPHTLQLLDLMQRLRDPDHGCPWDLRQDFASLIPYLIEESYEVIDAIERNDYDDLRLELGDLLLQIVFHAQIANEKGWFGFEDVAAGINEKIIRRHPHVFAGARFINDEERQKAWEQIKKTERRNRSGPDAFVSVLAGSAPISMPALAACQKTLTKAANVGFDWPEIEPIFEKVNEEIEEIKEACLEGVQARIEEEIGDLLLAAVNLSRRLNVNAETALKSANNKFSRRFEYIERKVAQAGKALEECGLSELDGYWNEAKQSELNAQASGVPK